MLEGKFVNILLTDAAKFSRHEGNIREKGKIIWNFQQKSGNYLVKKNSKELLEILNYDAVRFTGKGGAGVQSDDAVGTIRGEIGSVFKFAAIMFVVAMTEGTMPMTTEDSFAGSGRTYECRVLFCLWNQGFDDCKNELTLKVLKGNIP